MRVLSGEIDVAERAQMERNAEEQRLRALLNEGELQLAAASSVVAHVRVLGRGTCWELARAVGNVWIVRGRGVCLLHVLDMLACAPSHPRLCPPRPVSFLCERNTFAPNISHTLSVSDARILVRLLPVFS